MSIDAMKLALEAFDSIAEYCPTGSKPDLAYLALKQAIEEVEQEKPVAWVYEFYADMGHKGLAFEPQRSAYNVPLYTAPPPRKPLTDEEILWLVPGLLDCLCDPYDCDKTGDDYASIPKDMIRLARAIEAAHGIKE